MEKIRDLREKYFQIDDEYLNGYAKLCGINATGVYLSMCRHANKQQQCFPSKKLIAEELAISERSIYSATKELEKWGIIKIDDQGRKQDGSFKVKIYTLLDKKHWKPKPQANCAVGKKRHSPQANNDISPQATGAQEGNTYINQTHIKETKQIPPNKEDVIEYIQERNNGVDPDKWYDHYSANGWLVGRNKMKDWKAAVRTWESKKKEDYSSWSDFRLMEEKIRIQNERQTGKTVETNQELLKELNKRFSF